MSAVVEYAKSPMSSATALVTLGDVSGPRTTGTPPGLNAACIPVAADAWGTLTEMKIWHSSVEEFQADMSRPISANSHRLVIAQDDGLNQYVNGPHTFDEVGGVKSATRNSNGLQSRPRCVKKKVHTAPASSETLFYRDQRERSASPPSANSSLRTVPAIYPSYPFPHPRDCINSPTLILSANPTTDGPIRFSEMRTLDQRWSPPVPSSSDSQSYRGQSPSRPDWPMPLSSLERQHQHRDRDRECSSRPPLLPSAVRAPGQHHKHRVFASYQYRYLPSPIVGRTFPSHPVPRPATSQPSNSGPQYGNAGHPSKRALQEDVTTGQGDAYSFRAR
ncbi:hypothetical protein DL93DRAFT_2233762 [Clavulina sp. PMI_390]|nr:hypothetical protein DL93DRAFT_2233762 [Clavulina sp. PMI_390]